MASFNGSASQFIRYANVGYPVIVLVIVLGSIIRPAGAFMV
jgi:hypothetical protein